MKEKGTGYETNVWKPFNKDNYRSAWHDRKVIGVVREFKRDIKLFIERN